MKKLFLWIAFCGGLLPQLYAFRQPVYLIHPLTGDTVTQAMVILKSQYNQEFYRISPLPSGKILLLDSLPPKCLIYIEASGFKTMILSPEEFIGAITLSLQHEQLTELVFSANRQTEARKEVPQQLMIMDIRDIGLIQPRTTGDLLEQSGQVFVQTSQFGGGSPVLRGFEANRILLVVDGVRLNNAMFRGGHLHNAISIDPLSLGRMEVIFGPGAAMYGSDAMGGVIHFMTKNPALGKGPNPKVKTQALARYSSAAHEGNFSGMVEVGGAKWATLTQISVKSFDDVRSGSRRSAQYPKDFGLRNQYAAFLNGQDTMLENPDPARQVGSGYQQMDVLQKFIMLQKKRHLHILNLQLSATGNIPRYDRLSEYNPNSPKTLSWAEWYYGPQIRGLASWSSQWLVQKKWADQLRLTLSFQKIKEERFQRRYGTLNRDRRTEDLYIPALNVDVYKTWEAAPGRKDRHELRYGVEWQHNQLHSEAGRQNININGPEMPITTRYPGQGNLQTQGGIYFTHSWEFNPRWVLTEGIRGNYQYLRSEFSAENLSLLPLPFPPVILEKYTSLSGSIGLVRIPRDRWRLSLYYSSGFRAPNVDDLSRFFDSRPGASLQVPNPNLTSERTHSFEVSTQWSSLIKPTGRRFVFEWVSSISRAQGLISPAPFRFNGQDSVLFDGIMTQTVANINLDKAWIYYIYQSFQFDFNKSWSIFHRITYTRGRIEDGNPLDHIPPLFGKGGLQYQKSGWIAEAGVIWNGNKKLKDMRLNAEDNERFGTSEGFPGWYCINIKGMYIYKKKYTFSFGIDNLLDQHYRLFASGISAPGRNIYFSVNVRR